MAHPDEGYLPPEEIDPSERDPDGEWDDSWMVDPETGEGLFTSEAMEVYRVALLRERRLDIEQGIQRAGRRERIEELRALRRAALGRLANHDGSFPGVE